VIESSRWALESNSIVSAASEISIRLRSLADHYQGLTPASKVQILASAREIISLINELLKSIHTLSDICNDKRLRTAMMQSAEFLPTLAQQLKIMAAVRATAPGNDIDSQRQLESVVSNFIKAIKDVLRRAEAASLRTSTTASPTAIRAASKFKRNLYKGKNNSKSFESNPALNNVANSGSAALKAAKQTILKEDLISLATPSPRQKNSPRGNPGPRSPFA
jgi:hypothetical protein